jgi:phage-related protein
MALGLKTNAGGNITGFTGSVMFDKGASEKPKPRVLKAQFGDGYEMRAVHGINNTPRTFSLSFNNRTKEDIDNLYNFFISLASVTTCNLTIPDSSDAEEEIKVVIEDFNKTFNYDNYYSLTCQAREVFEA